MHVGIEIDHQQSLEHRIARHLVLVNERARLGEEAEQHDVPRNGAGRLCDRRAFVQVLDARPDEPSGQALLQRMAVPDHVRRGD